MDAWQLVTVGRMQSNHRACRDGTEGSHRQRDRRLEACSWRAGACFGAVFGALLALISGLYGLTIITIPVGGLVGAGCGLVLGVISGLVLGVINGVVLARLDAIHLLGRTPVTRLRRATTATVLTSGLSMFATQIALFGWISDQAPWFWLAYLPLGAGLLIAAVLTQQLPPGHAR